MNAEEVIDRVQTSCSEDIMKLGDYIVIQRKNYLKLHKISNKLCVMLGNNQLELSNVVGRPFSTTFRMVPKENKRNVFVLEECSQAVSLAEKLIKDFASGTDNRNIVGDGNSQKLSKDEIVGLRDSGMSGCDIVSQLLENSKTFQEKTEYSQKKYLNKKEKKYFDYVFIRKPTLRLVSEVIYKQDPAKIMSLRLDSLSQLITGVGISSGGTYIIYESSCEGLPTAALLNYLGESGFLVHTFPGLTPQRQAILAMNFNEAQKKRLISVSIQSLIQKLSNRVGVGNYTCQSQKSVCSSPEVVKGEKSDSLIAANDNMERKYSLVGNDEILHQTVVCNAPKVEQNLEEMRLSKSDSAEDVHPGNENSEAKRINQERKRKITTTDENDVKKPRWEMDLDRAIDLLSPRNVDGLVVVAREDPADIILALLPYIAPSRNFVVYCWCREPLVELYLRLKKHGGVINAHLTETFFRTHQVLPNRTHPDIQMSGSGGYILMGTAVLLQPPVE